MQSSTTSDQTTGGGLEPPQFRSLRDAVWANDDVGHVAKLVALRLVEHWPRIFPSLAFIGERCKLSERAVRYALRELESVGMIETEARHRKTSRYWFCSETGARVVIPKLGRGKPAGGGGTGGATQPSGDPDDFSEEEPPSHTGNVTSIRHGVPRSTQHSVPPTRHGVPLTRRHEVPPKRITLFKQKPKGGGSRAARAPGRKRPAPTPLFTSFVGWTLSAELRAELIELGVNARKIDRRVRALRNRPGLLGSGVESLDEYIREQAETRWVEWDAADAVSPGGTGARSSFGGGGATTGGGGDGGAPTRVPGFPAWVHPEHAELAKALGLQLKPAALAFAKQEHVHPRNRNPIDLRVPFREFLKALAQKKVKAA